MSNEENNNFQAVIRYFLQNEFSKEMCGKIDNYDEKYEDEKFEDELIGYCINKAWNDAMIYEKYSKNSQLKDNKDKIKEKFIIYIKNNRESQEIILKPKELFEKKSQELKEKGLEFVVNFQGEDGAYFGVFQKFINMSMKYLFCVKGKLKLKIDFTQCDVPIDSFILDWCKQVFKDGEQINLKDVVWNNLKIEVYIKIQEGIRAYVGEINKNISPLELEFYVWPIMKLQRAINQFNNAVSKKGESNYNPFSKDNIGLVGLSNNLKNDFEQFKENTKKINT